MFRRQDIFQNKLHELHTIAMNKIALSRDDDKRVIQSNGVSMLVHGHMDAVST